MKNVTGVAVIGVLSALSVTGWMNRVPQQVPVYPAAQPAALALSGPQDLYQQLPAQPRVQTVAAAAPWGGSNAPVFQRVADRRSDYRRPNRTYSDSYRRNSGYDPYNSSAPYEDNSYYRGDRPFSHSAAIVGGGAAAGAAIGGIAAGGKGAGIGALAGGAAGLIYDRLTHKNARW